jgi:hypothetical protein
MKHIAAMTLMLAGSYAHADCQDIWLIHQSSTLSLSVSYSGGCYQGELVLYFQKLSEKGSRWPSQPHRGASMPFDRECHSKRKNEDRETVEFSCRKSGASPLAGATYRFKQVEIIIQCDGVDLPNFSYFFVCIRGCRSTTPLRLEVQHGEGCA